MRNDYTRERDYNDSREFRLGWSAIFRRFRAVERAALATTFSLDVQVETEAYFTISF